MSTTPPQNDNDDKTKPDAAPEKEANDVAAMKKVLLDTKVDGNKSVWTMTLETFGMADGKTQKDDVQIEDLEQGKTLLKEYIASKNEQQKQDLMQLVPLNEFQATMDTFVMAFLKWAEKTDDKTGKTSINVSKARRRLDAYWEWMTDNQKDLQNLTLDSIQAAAKVWDIQVTYDKEGHFLWWIDLGRLEKEDVQKLEPAEHLRYVTWFSHLCMFDEKAQQNGAIMIEDMGSIGFWKLATMFPMDLGAKLDRLTIGILPVKMKKIYVFGAARWMSLLMALIKPFMGKKMRDRMILLPRKTDKQTFCDDLVTREFIPKGFAGLQGNAPRDELFDKLKSSGGSRST